MEATEQSTIHERVRLVIETTGLKANAFSINLDLNPSIIHHIIKGRNEPSFGVLVKILTKYPNINAEWLLLGIGRIYKDKSGSKEQPTLILDYLSRIMLSLSNIATKEQVEQIQLKLNSFVTPPN